jgi:FKBP-type peptidyl-prolyl cis-trans isomerase SlyD
MRRSADVIVEKSKVSIHYTLTVESEVVDSSREGDPLEYVQGSGQIIPGLEKALEGLKSGDKKNVTVEPELAYGPHNPDAIQKVPRSAFQDSDKLKVDDVVSGQIQDRPFQARVVSLSDEEVTLDLNHPLAGKTLNFAVEVLTVAES